MDGHTLHQHFSVRSLSEVFLMKNKFLVVYDLTVFCNTVLLTYAIVVCNSDRKFSKEKLQLTLLWSKT